MSDDLDLTTVDVVVLGMGPGGEDVAGNLAEAGLSVVGIEAGLVGGECPYWGCIPSKMMIRAAHLLAEASRIPGAGRHSSTVTPDWAPVAARIRAEATDNWDDTVAVDRFVGKGGTFVRGRGRLVAADTVEVDGHRYRATRRIVVATGTTAAVPPIPGLADTPYWTNHQAIEVERTARLDDRARRRRDRGRADPGVRPVRRRGHDRRGPRSARCRSRNQRPESCSRMSSKPRVSKSITGTRGQFGVVRRQVPGHSGRRPPTGRRSTPVATGRRVDLAGIGAELLGVDIATARSLTVDEHLRVTDGVWAVGDVTGRGAFTHVAMYQSKIAVADILGQPHTPADYSALPRVTFTDPEVGSVGLSAAAARQQRARRRRRAGEVPSHGSRVAAQGRQRGVHPTRRRSATRRARRRDVDGAEWR